MNEFRAEIVVSSYGDASAELKTGMNVEIHVDAKSKDDALEATKKLTNILAGGRLTYFRCQPEANSHTSFDTKETRHRGYARFALFDEPGEWKQARLAIDLTSTAHTYTGFNELEGAQTIKAGA